MYLEAQRKAEKTVSPIKCEAKENRFADVGWTEG